MGFSSWNSFLLSSGFIYPLSKICSHKTQTVSWGDENVRKHRQLPILCKAEQWVIRVVITTTTTTTVQTVDFRHMSRSFENRWNKHQNIHLNHSMNSIVFTKKTSSFKQQKEKQPSHIDTKWHNVFRGLLTALYIYIRL